MSLRRISILALCLALTFANMSRGRADDSDALRTMLALTQQMVNAGWKSKTALASDSDTQAFAIKNKDGVDWIAALSVVSIATNQYLFTAAAFKTTETGTSAVTAMIEDGGAHGI